MQHTIKDLRAMPYADYLKTQHWQSQRQQAKHRARYRCQVCNSTRQLEVHHRSYAYRGIDTEKELSDLIVLCRDHHSLFHEHCELVECPQATVGQIVYDAMRAILICWFG